MWEKATVGAKVPIVPENFRFKAIYLRVGVFFVMARFSRSKTSRFVSGHDFSRAVSIEKRWALAPATAGFAINMSFSSNCFRAYSSYPGSPEEVCGRFDHTQGPSSARREFPPRPPRASMLDAEKYGGQEANSRCAGAFPSGDGGLVSRRLRAAHRAPAPWLAGHRERRKCPDSRPDRQWQDSNCVSLVSGPA